jgi:hypothetical protein
VALHLWRCGFAILRAVDPVVKAQGFQSREGIHRPIGKKIGGEHGQKIIHKQAMQSGALLMNNALEFPMRFFLKRMVFGQRGGPKEQHEGGESRQTQPKNETAACPPNDDNPRRLD